MLTKQQIRDLKPAPFQPKLAYNRVGGMISPTNPNPRFKKEWDNVTRSYQVKKERGYYQVIKNK